MDALNKLNEHFLSCNTCKETFKDPCTLGCYHTFCRQCLTKYTKSRRDAITAKSILCPNCCQMTKVPRPQERVDQWCEQLKPSFIIQGLLDSFIHSSSDPIEDMCFSCQRINRTTQANSICEDCDIKFCEACVKIHVAAPNGRGHVISPLGDGSTPPPKKRKVTCKENNSVVEFCCRDCQKAVCHKCCIVYHRKCHSVVTLDSMIPEMKQVLQQNCDDIELYRQQTGNTLKRRRSEVEEITQHKSSLQSEIRRVSQQAMDLIRRKEKKLLDELDTLTEKQTGELRGQIKSGEIDLQTYQQYTEFIKQVLQSNSPMDLYDMYTLCQSGEITAEIQRKDKQGERTKKIEFVKQLDMNKLDRTLQIGHLKIVENISCIKDTIVPLSTIRIDTWSNLKCTPQPQSTISTDTLSNLQCTPELQSTVSTDTWPNLQCTPQLQSTVGTDTWSNLQCTPQLQSTVSTDTWPNLQCTPKLQSTVSTDTWPNLQCTPKLQSTVSTDTWPNLKCTPKLQSTVSTDTWPNLKCTPKLQSTVSTDTWPNLKCTPKLQSTVSTDTWPNLQCTPKLQSTVSTDTWPNLKCTPQPQSTISTDTLSNLQCTPELQSTVSTDTWPNLQCTPKLQSTVSTDTWSNLKCTPKLQSTVSTDTWPNLQCTPQLQSTVGTDTWSNLQCTPQLQSTVSTDTWPNLQCTPQLQSTVGTDTWSNLQCTPQLQSTVSTDTWPNLQCTPQLQSTVSTDTWPNLQCTPQLQSTVSTSTVSTDTWSSLHCTPQLQSTVSTSTVSTDTWSNLKYTPKLQSTVSTKSKDDRQTPDINDIEILTIGRTETLVVTDYRNKSIKSWYTKGGTPYCTSLQFDYKPHTITKISQDRVAVSYISHNSIELIKLTPDPVRITTVKTKKEYICLAALSETSLAAGCKDPPSIDVLDLSGRVLRSVITPSNGQQLIQRPWFMCTTRQGHIVVVDAVSGSVYCVTQQGEVLYTYKLTGRYWTGGVTTTDTDSVIVADYYGNKIVQLTERGEYVRDLLTKRDGIVSPQGVRVQGNKLYLTEYCL